MATEFNGAPKGYGQQSPFRQKNPQDDIRKQALQNALSSDLPNPDTGPTENTGWAGSSPKIPPTTGGITGGLDVGGLNKAAAPVVGSAMSAAVSSPSTLATGAVTRPTGDSTVAQATDLIKQAYQTYLGREPDLAEIRTHLQNQGWQAGQTRVGAQGLNDVITSIMQSPEAQTFNTRNEAATVLPSAGGVFTPEGGLQADLSAKDATPVDQLMASAPTAASKTSTATTGGSSTAMPSYMMGFDATKWNDPTHDSIKYTAGHILSQFPPTDEGWAQATAAIQAQFPNAQIIGNDKIDFGDGFGPIDVRHAAGAGGDGWQWEPTSGGTTGWTSATPAGGTSSSINTSSGDPQSIARQILQQILSQLSGGK